ncbi:MAG: Spy/CpxP family protein refolding chaperone [Acidobacteria bacterium]|nr:Spy/CpxP family protein refolding chaperone [Acidobacteriota bacterium]
MPGLEQIVRGLELTDEQRAEVQEIMTENRDQLEQARRDVIQAQGNLDADFPESASVLGAAVAEEALLRAQILKQIKQILTAEQLNLLEERQQMRKERHEKFPGPFGEGFEL